MKTLTAIALSSVSLKPALVMVALDRRRGMTPIVRAARRYAVDILAEDKQALSDCFAGAAVTRDRDELCGAPRHPGSTGLRLLDGALVHAECIGTQPFSAGDHGLFIGQAASASQLMDTVGARSKESSRR
jgi:flavin reductase (DIM6/NTAB) family NADH-FMN oxidoreductase RutF